MAGGMSGWGVVAGPFLKTYSHKKLDDCCIELVVYFLKKSLLSSSSSSS